MFYPSWRFFIAGIGSYQGNQLSGDFEVDKADIEKHPGGVFFREGGEKGGLLLPFSITKKKEGKKNVLSKRDFAPADATGGSEQLRCSTLDPRRLRGSGQSF